MRRRTGGHSLNAVGSAFGGDKKAHPGNVLGGLLFCLGMRGLRPFYKQPIHRFTTKTIGRAVPEQREGAGRVAASGG